MAAKETKNDKGITQAGPCARQIINSIDIISSRKGLKVKVMISRWESCGGRLRSGRTSGSCAGSSPSSSSALSPLFFTLELTSTLLGVFQKTVAVK